MILQGENIVANYDSASTATQNDTDKLLELEAEAESLRELFKD